MKCYNVTNEFNLFEGSFNDLQPATDEAARIGGHVFEVESDVNGDIISRRQII